MGWINSYIDCNDLKLILKKLSLYYDKKTLDHLIIAVEDLETAETDYAKVFGVDPVWKGEHKELGTTNSLFNFNNTYFELLSASGDGLGAMLVNHALEETGEGLIGMVLGTDDIAKTANDLKNKSF